MKAPSRVTNSELLGQHMEDAAKELGLESPYGESPRNMTFRVSHAPLVVQLNHLFA